MNAEEPLIHTEAGTLFGLARDHVRFGRWVFAAHYEMITKTYADLRGAFSEDEIVQLVKAPREKNETEAARWVGYPAGVRRALARLTTTATAMGADTDPIELVSLLESKR